MKGMWQNTSMEKKGFKVEKDNENDTCWISNDEKYRWLNARRESNRVRERILCGESG